MKIDKLNVSHIELLEYQMNNEIIKAHFPAETLIYYFNLLIQTQSDLR